MTQDVSVRPTPGQPMSEEDLGSALSSDLHDAATYADTELGPLRAAAIHYYRARKFGDEEDGRSQVVMPIVRDTIRATLPSLMRTFFGSTRAIEFSPATQGAGDFADDATAAIEYIFTVQNDGFNIAWDTFKEALRCKTGWIKWFWDESIEVTGSRYGDCTQQQVFQMEMLLQPGEEIRVIQKKLVGYQQAPQQQAPMGQQGPMPAMQSADLGAGQMDPDALTHSPVRETGEGLQIPGPAIDDDGVMQEDEEGAGGAYGAALGMSQGGTGGGGGQVFDGLPGHDGEDSAAREFNPYAGAQVQNTQPQRIPVFAYDIEVVRKVPKKCIRILSIPSDEIIFPHDMWDYAEGRLICHRTRKTRGELVAMGIDAKDLESIPSDDLDQLTNIEFLARQTIPSAVMTQMASATWDQVRVPYYECYYRIDADGDGISELRKICRIGKTGKIVSNEIWDEVPLALLCPDREPFVVVGMSMADHIMDLQNIQSHVWRDLLDSLKQSIFPRTAVVEGQVDIDDALNTEIGAVIRQKAPGMVNHLVVPFTGKEAFPLLESLDQVREQRTGLGQAALAMDGRALQSTTPVAAQQSITASQAQVEMVARCFANGFARMFRGVLRLLCKHQNTPLLFQLNGRTFNVNPKDWNPDLYARPNEGLGMGTNTQQQLEVLDGVAKAQMQIMGQLGPNNPLCGMDTYYNTVTRMMQLGGFKDTSRYWLDPRTAQQTGRQINPPPPNPEQIKSQSDQAIKAQQLNFERFKVIMDDNRQRDAANLEARVRLADIRAKYGTHVDGKILDTHMQREQMASDERINQANNQAEIEQARAQPAPQSQQ